MTQAAWVRGMALLVANLKAPELTSEMAMLRGDTYRRKLGHLTDDAWLYAVERALEEPGGWFPGIGDLLDFAARAPVMAPSATLPDDTRTLEEKRADARRFFEFITAELAAREKDLSPKPIATVPPAGETVVVLSDERLDILRAQAREIGGAAAVAVAEIERRS